MIVWPACVRVRSLIELNRKDKIDPFSGGQISHTSCAYTVALTWLASWHRKDVEHRMWASVYLTSNPTQRPSGHWTEREGTCLVFSERLPIICKQPAQCSHNYNINECIWTGLKCHHHCSCLCLPNVNEKVKTPFHLHLAFIYYSKLILFD